MRIWLDDIRPIPENFYPSDRYCNIYEFKTAEDCIQFLDFCITSGEFKHLEFISLDHDLSPEHYGYMVPYVATGYEVANWFERMSYAGKLTHFPKWECHSQNPVGKANIEAAMKSAENEFNRQKGE